MMKRNLPAILTFALALAVLAFATACNKNSNANNSSGGNSSNASGSTKTTSGGMSPTEVYKAYYDASFKKDFTTAKKYLSQGTMAVMEAEAQRQGKTFEELMKESPAVDPHMPPLSNEKINGDTATVDMTVVGRAVAIPFVKENGEWKVALDKLARDVIDDSKNGSVPTENGDDDEDHDNSNH